MLGIRPRTNRKCVCDYLCVVQVRCTSSDRLTDPEHNGKRLKSSDAFVVEPCCGLPRDTDRLLFNGMLIVVLLMTSSVQCILRLSS